MKNKIISIISYLIALISLSLYIFAEIEPHLSLTSETRLALLLFSCIFLYFGGFFLSKYSNNNKSMKINLWIFFILYSILLITLTLFDPMWGRNGFNITYSKELFQHYLETSVNLIPFKTIIEYIKAMFYSFQLTSNIFYNLIGNFVCFMPFGLFIPILFKQINNTNKFLITILFITLGIEITQFLTLSGSFDIDDIILNTSGAFVAYKILNIKDINNSVKNIFLLENNRINKKKLIQVLLIIILICTFIFGLIRIRENNYNQKLEEFYSKNYNLKL